MLKKLSPQVSFTGLSYLSVNIKPFLCIIIIVWIFEQFFKLHDLIHPGPTGYLPSGFLLSFCLQFLLAATSERFQFFFFFNLTFPFDISPGPFLWKNAGGWDHLRSKLHEVVCDFRSDLRMLLPQNGKLFFCLLLRLVYSWHLKTIVTCLQLIIGLHPEKAARSWKSHKMKMHFISLPHSLAYGWTKSSNTKPLW